MAKITQEMKDIAGNSKTFIMATASKKGIPNGVPIGFTRIISDDEVMLVDNFMYKSRQNIAENPVASVTYWSPEDRYGFQLKGKARVETAGKLFEEAKRWVKERRPEMSAKAAVIVKVEEIYYIGGSKDSSIRLDKAR